MWESDKPLNLSSLPKMSCVVDFMEFTCGNVSCICKNWPKIVQNFPYKIKKIECFPKYKIQKNFLTTSNEKVLRNKLIITS